MTNNDELEKNNELEIKTWDMSEQTLYFADVLKLIVNKFNIKQISRAKIVFTSLEELENFPIPIDTSTIFVFDSIKHNEIDLSKIKVYGSSLITFSTSIDKYLEIRQFNEYMFFTSILNAGEHLFNRINNNLNKKEFYFYDVSGKNRNEEQINLNLKVPITLIW